MTQQSRRPGGSARTPEITCVTCARGRVFVPQGPAMTIHAVPRCARSRNFRGGTGEAGSFVRHSARSWYGLSLRWGDDFDLRGTV